MSQLVHHPRAGQGPYRYRHHTGPFREAKNKRYQHEMRSYHHDGHDDERCKHHRKHNNNDHENNDESNEDIEDNKTAEILRTGIFEMSGIDISDADRSFPAYYECELRPNGLLYGVRDKKEQCFGRWKEIENGKGLIKFTLEWDGAHYEYIGKYNNELKQFGGQWAVLDSKKKEDKGENGSFLYSVYFKNPLPESETQQIKDALIECQKLLKKALKNIPGFKAKITMDIESKL